MSMRRTGSILVVDDNAGIRSALKILLGLHFAEVRLLDSPVSLISEVEAHMPDCVLLDMNFSSERTTGNEGLFWLSELHTRWPSLRVILFTAYADVPLAVEGMKRGASDFVVKPWDNDVLIGKLKALPNLPKGEACDGQNSATSVTKEASLSGDEGDLGCSLFWGTSPAMQRIKHQVERIAATDATILITGENGTGKDVLAHEIHRLSLRSKKPFVAVDAGAIPDTLFESELFGHVKGAFTDARSDHAGRFEQANGGTLFLDEIGNIPLAMQAKLLRVIQNRSVTRLGSEKEIKVDIRLLSATNQDLEAGVKAGTFRQDLFYRLNTISLHLPSLRERREDIVPLAMIFLRRYAEQYHRSATGFTPQAEELLQNGQWPGNVRELQHVVEKAVILSEGSLIGPDDLQDIEATTQTNHGGFGTTLDDAEEQAIRRALDQTGGNLSAVAKMLGISRPTLYSRLKKYGL